VKVELIVPGSIAEPRLWVKHQPVLALALRHGSIEMVLRRSETIRVTYDTGEMSLVPRHLENRTDSGDLDRSSKSADVSRESCSASNAPAAKCRQVQSAERQVDKEGSQWAQQ
jgi:hypothetical protein